MTACGPAEVQVAPPTPTGSVAEHCANLGAHLPGRLQGMRSEVTAPKSPLTHAWGRPPVILRCGVGRPTGYKPTSTQTTEVDGVTWFQQVDRQQVTWTAILADINVELIVPTAYDEQGPFLADLAVALRVA